MGACCSSSAVHVPQAQRKAVSGKVRILCLHGDGTNDKLSKMQLAPLQDALERLKLDAELVYVNGPQAVEYIAGGIVGKTGRSKAFESQFGKQMYRWFEWIREPIHETEGGGTWPDVSEAVASSKALMTGSEPIHGVVGFSQGGAVGALIAALAQRRDICQKEALRFVVLMSAPQYIPLSEPQACIQDLFGAKLRTPSLHSYGKQDPHVKYIKEFVPLFDGAEEHEHGSGHQPFPADENEKRLLADKIANFIKKQTK